jgi:hypothetical protein
MNEKYQQELCTKRKRALQMYEQRIQGRHMGMYGYRWTKRQVNTTTKGTEVVAEHVHTYRNTCHTLTRFVVKGEIVGSAREGSESVGFQVFGLFPKQTQKGHRPNCRVQGNFPFFDLARASQGWHAICTVESSQTCAYAPLLSRLLLAATDTVTVTVTVTVTMVFWVPLKTSRNFERAKLLLELARDCTQRTEF